MVIIDVYGCLLMFIDVYGCLLMFIYLFNGNLFRFAMEHGWIHIWPMDTRMMKPRMVNFWDLGNNEL